LVRGNFGRRVELVDMEGMVYLAAIKPSMKCAELVGIWIDG
jgi:hypothetical protein